MKFTVTRTALFNLLQTESKVISNKNTLPILDYFLFDLKGESLKVTASDLETTLSGSIAVSASDEDGVIAIPSKLALDALKELKEQPIQIQVDPATWMITISWSNGKLSVPGTSGHSYPEISALDEESHSLSISSDILSDGITRSIFATAEDELRPVMNGIYIVLENGTLTFVATDAHKLVKYAVGEMGADDNAAFILPKKPANLLRNILGKNDFDVKLDFDTKNAVFVINGYTMTCRLVEGNYPNYNSVIPQNNTEKVIVDRLSLLASIKLAAVFSNQSTNLVRLNIQKDVITLIAEDADFSTSAEQTIACSYSGEGLQIGFKSTYLIEILSNIDTQEVLMSFSDSTRAALFMPSEDGAELSGMLMLLMPMIIK